MKPSAVRVYFVFVALFFYCIVFFASHSYGYYGCGGSPCNGSYPCNSGLTCKSSVCGIYYNVCAGAVCNGTGGWDQSSCNTANQCNNAGTTRTAAWVDSTTCSPSCGVGTKTAVCTCGAQNNCTVTCNKEAGGTAACNGTDTQTCCTSQLPQIAPAVTTVGSGNCSKNSPMTVNWTFNDTGSDCDLAWGFACSAGNVQANVNTFTIKVDGNLNTQNIAADVRTATISTTAIASHQIQVCAENGFGEKCSADFSVTIDNTAPPKPVDSMQYIQDPSCLGRYSAKYSWTAVTDTGCAGGVEYWAQGSSGNAVNPDGGFKTILNGWDLNGGNTWGSVTTRTAAQSYSPGTQLYFHVQSRDAVDNQSGWTTTTASAIIPTPSPFPPIHVDGALVEKISDACYGGLTVDPTSFTFQPVLNPSDGTTANCQITNGGTKYSCDFNIDNQHGACYDNTLQIQLSGTYPGYGIMGWHLGDACTGDLVSINFTPGESKSDVPLYLEYGGSDPNDGNWFKLSKTSFNSRLSGRNNVVPRTFSAFDSDDSTATRNIMINSSGVLVQNSPMIVGTGTVSYSSSNWYTSGYQYSNDVSYQKYVDYLKARKDFKTVTDVTQITTDGIYSMTAPVNLVSAQQFDGKKVVLVVEGDAATTFEADFKPAGGSVAVLGKNIEIDPAVTEIDAIIIGETVSTGASSSGLKIKGNLIDESALPIERSLADKRKPSLFVILDTKMYLDVLPYLSTSTYDWRQIQ